MHLFLYHPNEKHSAAADFIPFYDNGKFHLFYLFDHRNNEKFGEGIPWYKIETNDFLHFADKGEMICRGNQSDFDLSAFTGCVIYAFGQYHIFYTGHNTYIHTYGHQNECIMHAVSSDLDHWTKLPEDTFFAPDGYDRCDFRDPFVYFSETDSQYYMLLCARSIVADDGIRTGETIRMKSSNLKTWEFDTSIYAPGAFQTHECPDLFQMNSKWYLIFSEYSDRNVTCYRISDTPNGPWIKPKNDTFDGRAYYAAKTAFDGENRYMFGWVPTRMDNRDNGNWMWGGGLVVHRLLQNPDGTLCVAPPEQILNHFRNVQYKQENLPICASERCTIHTIQENAPRSFHCSFTVTPSPNCDQFGILFGRDSAADSAYAFRFDLSENRLSVNRFPCFPQNEFATYMLNRPLPPTSQYNVNLLIDNDIAIVYVNDSIALSVRVCDTHATGLGLYVSNGDANFTNITLTT